MNFESSSLMSERILSFYAQVDFDGKLPDGIQMMNPYRENQNIPRLCTLFYHKFYNDRVPRKLILGINPGRLGAGATGIPFTDTKRLSEKCDIPFEGFKTHEPSSVFMYKMMDAYGGPTSFYQNFYISSVCPLGFVKSMPQGKVVNYNYYDDVHLQVAVLDFIIKNIRDQIKICGRNDICYCLGTGKNFQFLSQLNQKYRFFEKITPLEHPRYVMQYQSKNKDRIISSYLEKLSLNP